MSTIAFIGLGIMGAPMAGHLVDAGHTVVGYNRSQGAIDTLVSRGGKGATSVADAVAEAEVVITMVPDSPDVHDGLTDHFQVRRGRRSGVEGARWRPRGKHRPGPQGRQHAGR